MAEDKLPPATANSGTSNDTSIVPPTQVSDMLAIKVALVNELHKRLSIEREELEDMRENLVLLQNECDDLASAEVEKQADATTSRMKLGASTSYDLLTIQHKWMGRIDRCTEAALSAFDDTDLKKTLARSKEHKEAHQNEHIQLMIEKEQLRIEKDEIDQMDIRDLSHKDKQLDTMKELTDQCVDTSVNRIIKIFKHNSSSYKSRKRPAVNSDSMDSSECESIELIGEEDLIEETIRDIVLKLCND